MVLNILYFFLIPIVGVIPLWFILRGRTHFLNQLKQNMGQRIAFTLGVCVFVFAFLYSIGVANAVRNYYNTTTCAVFDTRCEDPIRVQGETQEAALRMAIFPFYPDGQPPCITGNDNACRALDAYFLSQQDIVYMGGEGIDGVGVPAYLLELLGVYFIAGFALIQTISAFIIIWLLSSPNKEKIVG